MRHKTINPKTNSSIMSAARTSSRVHFSLTIFAACARARASVIKQREKGGRRAANITLNVTALASPYIKSARISAPRVISSQ